VAGASAYKVYRLGTEYMEELTSDITFSGASAILTNQSTTEDEYYAVSAVTGSNEGQRTMGLKKSVGDIVADPQTFSALAASSSQINLTWTKNVVESDVMVAWSATADFGIPVNGTAYTVGNSITGGGTVLYKGNLTSFSHAGLDAYTTYYYKIWSVSTNKTYSIGVIATETTDCATTYGLPFEENFTSVTSLPNCWKQKDNQGNGEVWQFGTTSAGTSTPALTGNYAYINSYSSSNNLRNADLITPTFDLSSNSNIILSFNHQFVEAGNNANTASVSYSIDNGISWTLFKTFSGTSNPSTYTSSVLTELQGKSQVKFKWTYTSNAWTFYWAVDDIKIIDATNYWSGATDTDWFKTTNWSTGEIPTTTAAVIIPSMPTNQPQINAAGAVCAGITIQNGASLTMNNSMAYTLLVSGDWINDGTFTPGIGTVDFNGTNELQTIMGSSTTNFYFLKVTKGDQGNILEATSLITLSAPDDALVLTSGTFKLSSASTITLFTSSTTLGNTAGLWNNGGTITSNASSLTVNGGLLRNSMGIMNISGYQSIIYMNNGIIRVDGGQLNVGRGIRPNSETSSGTIIISGGAVTLRTSTSTYDVNLDINPSASLTWTDGTVVVQRYASAVAHEIRLEPNTYTISGGTLQIGNASTPVSQTIRINSTVPIYNLVVNATNSPTAQLVTNGLTVLNDVTISGGTLDANDLNLNIGGNWTNNGNFTPGTGTVTFDGFNSQTIGGTADNIFNNLAIDGTDVILATTTALKLTSVSSALTINTGKRLTIPSGQFLTISGTLTNDASTSGLVIESDASGTGSLIHSTADVDATVERYLNNADFGNWKDGWHFLGSPVANQEISPAFTTDPASGYDFYCWFEPDNEWINYKNTTEATTWLIANGSTQFNTGKGYMAAYDVEATKLFTGKLNIGDVGISGLTITGGNQNRSWHLLGNPFSSALSWDATAAWTLINIGGVAKIWNEANQGYSDLTSSPASSIPATNGFMVSVVSGTGSLTIPAAKRSHSSVPFYKSTLPAIMLKAISLSEGNAQESRIAVNPLAQEGFDLMFDSEFLGGYAPVFYSIVNGEKYSTNTIPVIDDKTEIPFVFVKNEGSNFRIEISGTETLETKAFLHDLKTGDIVNIIENPEYSFTSFEGDSPLRFKLTFGDQAPSQEEGIRIFYSQNTLNIFNAEGECLIEVFGMTGQLLLKRQTTDSSIPINLSTGVYMVRVSSQAGVDKVKILVN
jgi:hypothetical protein